MSLLSSHDFVLDQFSGLRLLELSGFECLTATSLVAIADTKGDIGCCRVDQVKWNITPKSK